MDEAYDSPDSDGHASIPSPTETSFMSTIHNTRNWPPMSPSDASSDGDDDDEPIVVFRRYASRSKKRMLPRILDSSPMSSRILKPTTMNSDSNRTTPKQSHRKRNSENIDPSQFETTSDDESKVDDNTQTKEIQDGGQRRHAEQNGIASEYAKDPVLLGQTPPETNEPHSPEIAVRLDRKISMRSVSRVVSGVSAASNDVRNENFEEIDPSTIIERMSQSSLGMAQSQKSPDATQVVSSNGPHNNAREGISDDASPDSILPHTPPKKRTLVQARRNLASSLKHSLLAASTDTVSPASSPPKTPNNERSTKYQRDASNNIYSVLSVQGLESPSPVPSPVPQRSSHSPLVNGPSEEGTSKHASPLGTEGGHSTTTPQYPYESFNLWKFKKSKSARRMSINTPPSQSSQSTTATEFLRKDPPSPLESDFRFSQGQCEPRSQGAAVDIFSDNEPEVPPNSAVNTPTTQNTRLPLMERLQKGRARERSRSDPIDSRAAAAGSSHRRLFTPSRVEKIGEVAPDMDGDRSSTLGDSTSDRHILGTQNGESDLEEGQVARDIDCDNVNGQNLWSGFSQDFRPPRHHYEAEGSIMQEKEADSSQAHIASPGSLRLGDVEVRVQTPTSVKGDTSAPVEDSTSLRHRTMELENILSVVLKGDEGRRSEIIGLNNLIAQYEEQHGRAYDDVEQQREKIRSLEQYVVKLEGEITQGQLGSDITSASRILARQNAQRFLELQAKIDSLERSASEHSDTYRRESEEKEKAIRHLRAALDQRVNSTINEPLHNRVIELEAQIQQERKIHGDDIEAREAKFSHILEERDAEVNHLQAELDDLANLMPVDHSTRTSRIFEEDDTEEWMDEKSREVFDESIGHIITEIHGNSEREDIDRAAEEAEISLRHLAANAGLEDMNKASLAAFGIRQLREENELLRSMCTESEERVKQLMEANSNLGGETESLKLKIQQLSTHNSTLHKSVTDSQIVIENMRKELEQLQVRFMEKSSSLEETRAANKTLHSLNGQVNTLKAELVTIQQSYSHAQKELEKSKAQVIRAEQETRAQADGLAKIQNQLGNSDTKASGLQAEVDAYKQRTSELLRTVETADKNRKDQVMVLEQQVDDLTIAKEALVKERDTAKESASWAEERANEAVSTIRTLEEQIAFSDDLLTKLKNEKVTLEASANKAETEAKQTRSRFNVLLHESTEKETIWNSVKSELQAEIEQKSRELHHSIEPYEKALARIANEVDEVAPERPGDMELFHMLAEECQAEDIANSGLVAGILVGIKALDELIDSVDRQHKELEQKNARLKAAIKKWGVEHNKEKGKVDGLKKENKELALKLKAEKKQSEEKIGQLILALRR